MERSVPQSPNRQSRKLRRLRGKPLTSRAKWLTLKVAYILACVIGVVVVLMFTHGLVLAVGLTVMAFFAGGLLELFALRYRDYHKEWELANGGDFEPGR
jgi:membrane protein YdbS with pleckstrin-like domain